MRKSIFLAAALVCGMAAANAQDTRTEVSEIVATGFVKPEYGNSTAVYLPVENLIYPDGAPYYLSSSSGAWYLKDSDGNWNPYNGDFFVAGEYHYTVQVRIDDSYGTTHKLAETFTATINGQEWTVISSVNVFETFSYSKIKSPVYTVVFVALPLTFDATGYETGNCYVGRAIEKDLKAFTGGGATGNYTYTKKTMGVDWVQVSADGIVSGTPTLADVTTETHLIEVECTDGSETVKSHFTVGAVYINPDDRAQITDLSLTTTDKATLGAVVTTPTLIAPPDAPYHVWSAEWMKKDDGGIWRDYTEGTFTEGTYTIYAHVRCDGENGHNYVLLRPLAVGINGETGTVAGYGVGDDWSFVTVYSPETVLSKTTALAQAETPAIHAENGRVVCEEDFRIYDLLGRDVTKMNGSLNGVYVVKCGETAVKIVAR